MNFNIWNDLHECFFISGDILVHFVCLFHCEKHGCIWGLLLIFEMTYGYSINAKVYWWDTVCLWIRCRVQPVTACLSLRLHKWFQSQQEHILHVYSCTYVSWLDSNSFSSLSVYHHQDSNARLLLPSNPMLRIDMPYINIPFKTSLGSTKRHFTNNSRF